MAFGPVELLSRGAARGFLKNKRANMHFAYPPAKGEKPYINNTTHTFPNVKKGLG